MLNGRFELGDASLSLGAAVLFYFFRLYFVSICVYCFDSLIDRPPKLEQYHIVVGQVNILQELPQYDAPNGIAGFSAHAAEGRLILTCDRRRSQWLS